MNNILKTIGWADKSWNPITGCLNNCEYCYARKIYKRFKRSFKPQIHYDRLSELFHLRKPSRIFVGSATDLWGKGVKQIWRDEVYNAIKAYPEHTYYILTKQPQNITEWDNNCIPEEVFVGVTITKHREQNRIITLREKLPDNKQFISFEPLLSGIELFQYHVDWVIIGDMTVGGRSKKMAKPEWIQDVLNQSNFYQIPVFMKSNLKSVWPGIFRQEWPTARRKL